ncbi:MAG: type III secretion system chaperone [Succinivibrio sp.]|nr:type III secretion system chaperone [Succinivibrio sp.]
MDGAELIRQLGQKIGISDLALSQENSCGVLFDDDDVLFEVHNGNLFIVAEIGRGAEADREKLFEIFMDANHLGHATGFGSLGYDPEREMFTLTRVLPEEIEFAKFEEQLVLFIKALRYWKNYLKNGGPVEEESSAQPSSMLGGLS